MGESCECRLCQRHRRVGTVKKEGSVEELRALVDELYSALGDVEFDNEYYHAIFDGSWPSAEEQARGILERCAARKEQG
jgi:hypothetical protein